MSIKKYIYWGIFIGFVFGSVITGSPFNLIDFVVVRPIVNILFVIFNLVHDFGLAIIIFTILVKLCMWPLTKKQLNQTRLMRKLKPELTQIKKNCKGNKQLESLQTMDLYKRYNVKPFASILTLIIQLPIFIAIFSAIRVIATPLPQDNLMNRAYDIVAYEGSEIKNLEEKQAAYLADLTNNEVLAEEKTTYDFYPQLFGVIRLDVKASDALTGKFSCAIVDELPDHLVLTRQGRDVQCRVPLLQHRGGQEVPGACRSWGKHAPAPGRQQASFVAPGGTQHTLLCLTHQTS